VELSPQSSFIPKRRKNFLEEALMKRRLTLVIALITTLAIPATANTLVVSEVRGGCIVVFEGGFTVHLAGISIPGPKTRIGWQAYAFAKRRLEGKRVAVYTWTTDNTAAGIVRGKDGLPFAKIVYGAGQSGKGTSIRIDIAAELLELGYAKVDPDRLPEGYEHYRELERRAKDRQVGLWASAV
jgi:endonuclease YncB( thermonuclease family)